MTAAEIGAQLSKGSTHFDAMARAAFYHQRSTSPTYARFVGNHEWTGWADAPFLPVEAFKWTGIIDEESTPPQVVFQSSGTGGRKSRHPVVDLDVYERSVATHFAEVFGPGPFHIVAHLPTYRRTQAPSSLLYMLDVLIRRFGSPGSCSVVNESDVIDAIDLNGAEKCPLLVFGTAFGLLDLADRFTGRLPQNAAIVETGGMKTYRREITRSTLHQRLSVGFGLERSRIWSEYGMCELLSQCYTRGEETFYSPPWVRFKLVDVEDPERPVENGHPGLLALFDLANVHSVSAVLTSDVAVIRTGGFEILGRADAAEIRGCNFLMHPDP